MLGVVGECCGATALAFGATAALGSATTVLGATAALGGATTALGATAASGGATTALGASAALGGATTASGANAALGATLALGATAALGGTSCDTASLDTGGCFDFGVGVLLFARCVGGSVLKGDGGFGIAGTTEPGRATALARSFALASNASKTGFPTLPALAMASEEKIQKCRTRLYLVRVSSKIPSYISRDTF